MLLSFFAEYPESVLEILSHRESIMGPVCLGLEKNFQNQGSRRLENAILKVGLCLYSKCFLQLYFLSTVVQALRSIQLFKNCLITTTYWLNFA